MIHASHPAAGARLAAAAFAFGAMADARAQALKSSTS